MTETVKRRAVFRPVDRDALRRSSNGSFAGGGGARGSREADEPLLTRMLRAALAAKPLHVSFVPARKGENNIAEKDALELPVVHAFLAAHSKTTDDSPDFHAINQQRPPMIGMAMAEQALRGDTLPTVLADVLESGVPTTYGDGNRFPLQDMDGYEVMAVARGHPEKRGVAVSYLRDVARGYNAAATDVLYHPEPDARPTDPVRVVLVFELTEPLLDELAPGLRESAEYRNWYSPYTKVTA